MKKSYLAGFLFLVVAIGCMHQTMNDPTATATLAARSGSNVSGSVAFKTEGDAVRVRIDATGVPPGVHGFHVHEKGDCSAPDATSAGGHFNPAGNPHGGPGDPARHAGDFGNISADTNGEIHTEITVHGIAFVGPSSAVGKAVILHAKPDDLRTQPTGDAGGRIACGVVTLAGAMQ